MKKRLLGSLLAALFVVGLMAPAALAGVNGVAAFTLGQATVGENITGCVKHSRATVSGEGLNVVPTGNDYGYALRSEFTLVGTDNEGNPDVYVGEFSVCGYMTDPLNQEGVGAGCASTKGHNGSGEATGQGTLFPENNVDLKIYNVNWKAAVTGLLVVTGNYQVYGDGGTKKNKAEGVIVALVGAAPNVAEPTDCLAPPLAPADGTNGQNQFDVTGVATLAQLGQDMEKGGPILPGPGDKECPVGNDCGGDAKP